MHRIELSFIPLLLLTNIFTGSDVVDSLPSAPAVTSAWGKRPSHNPVAPVRRKSHRFNPVKVGFRSAILGMPMVRHASAFTGELSLPPQQWHQPFASENLIHQFDRLSEEEERLKRGGRGDPRTKRTRDETRDNRTFTRQSRGTKRTTDRDGMLSGKKMGEGIKSILSTTKADEKGASTTTTDTTSFSISKPQLNFWESMICGAVSRSVSQTLTHPANAMKTILQSSRRTAGATGEAVTLATLARPTNLRMLTRGAGAQFLLSLPQGAMNFAVLEYIRSRMNTAIEQCGFSEQVEKNGVVGAGLDFLSSAAATVCCSVFSGPQTMVTDNIMAGTYPNLPKALSGIASEGGVQAFYTGWWPMLAGKVPSYGLTWVIFQQLKNAHQTIFDRPPKNVENSVMGCIASGTTVCIMIPLDTIKTRLMTQAQYPHLVPYKGITDCAVRMLKEEGISSFYRGLTPRLVSVVPMIGIQFGVYEFMKRKCLEHDMATRETPRLALQYNR